MPKAETQSITLDPGRDRPGRRAVMAVLAVVPTVAVGAAATRGARALASRSVTAAGAPALIDSNLELGRIFDGLAAQRRDVCGQFELLRQKLVQRHGDPLQNPQVRPLWDRDPDRATLGVLLDQEQQISERMDAVMEAMLATPATSLAGVAAKMRAVLEDMPAHEKSEVFHDRFASSMMKEALRLFSQLQRAAT